MPRGFSSARIAEDIQKTGKISSILEYNKAIILIINETKDQKELKNIAVAYIIGEAEHQKHSSKVAIPDNNIIFESICKQIIFALDKTMTESGTRKILTSIGLYGSVLDGLQRSNTINGFNYIMKLQPNGMIMMVVSHI